jgi:signal transduction histidine kinase
MWRMSRSRKFGLAALAVLAAVVAAIEWFMPRGFATTSFGDLVATCMLGVASVAFCFNAIRQPRARIFWLLLGLGCILWTINSAIWSYYEVVLRQELPEPCIGDVILFIHVVTFMAAVALLPHRPRGDRKTAFDAINFFVVLVWWLFLYAFVVFPDQYVKLNVSVYSRNYDLLYLVENLVLCFVLGIVAASTQGAWRRIDWNLFVGSTIYTVGSEAINAAIARGQYYSGGIYDFLLLVSIAWLTWTAISARRVDLTVPPNADTSGRWANLAPRLAMIAILSLPLLGLWALYANSSSPDLRNFRLLATMAATTVLGGFVFLKQILLDRQLIRLLDQSRHSYENLERLQSQLVQKEKLASLGQLVAGAAHEINNPLAAILGYSELLASQASLQGEQASMAQKIGQQARRTRDLVSDLLSFSQQSPSEKSLLDIGGLVQRALQMNDVQIRGKNIRVEAIVEPGLPRIWGNSNQLLQTFLHLTENAIDALNDVGGGALLATARHVDQEIIIEFSDSGPGMADPERVFDPFYTTKPVGKGTGLGLSASYGVVQDHHGQISCRNKPDGGALFILRFPVAARAAAAVEAGK